MFSFSCKITVRKAGWFNAKVSVIDVDQNDLYIYSIKKSN